MKLTSWVATITIGALLIGTNAGATAWTSPTFLKVVQKDQASGTHTYTTIAAALSAITNNSATNRYLIKVMPGTYVQSTPLQMKPYVDVEGSGQSNTVISATNIPLDRDIWDALAPTKATVVMAANMKLSNLRVVNNTPANGLAILITSASVRVEDVTVDASGAGDCGVSVSSYYGIGAKGSTVTDLILRNVTARAREREEGGVDRPGATYRSNAPPPEEQPRARREDGQQQRGLRETTVVHARSRAFQGPVPPGSGLRPILL